MFDFLPQKSDSDLGVKKVDCEREPQFESLES
jgi:hypothetical protein